MPDDKGDGKTSVRQAVTIVGALVTVGFALRYPEAFTMADVGMELVELPNPEDVGLLGNVGIGGAGGLGIAFLGEKAGNRFR